MLRQLVASDITATTLSGLYILGDKPLGFSFAYTAFLEEVDGRKDRLSQVDLSVAFKVFSEEALKGIGEVGIRSYSFKGESLSGLQLGSKLSANLNEKLGSYVSSKLAWIKDSTINQFEIGLGYKISKNYSAQVGYRSLGLLEESISLSGPFLGVSYATEK